MGFNIENLFAYELIDSRGNPTVACVAKISKGNLLGKKSYSAKVMVPSGASTGSKEALELRDGDSSRFLGKGVKKSVHYINYVLGPSLTENNINPANQAELDQFLIDLDGTENKSRYGANTILAVSLAVAKAVAKAKKVPFYQYVSELSGNPKVNRFVLPLPMVNVINGGAHSDNTLDFQEFMFVPVGASSMHEAIRISAECFHYLAKYLKEKGLSTAKGDEGGFAPNLTSTEEALNAMMIAIERAGYIPGVIHGHVAIALDCAASELYDENFKAYRFKKTIKAGFVSESAGTKTTSQMVDYYVELINKYPIISIEDPLAEDDFEGFRSLQSKIGDKVQIVGDDLYCTNPQLTQMGIDRGLSNAILIKVNQIGTLSETLKTMQLAKNAGWSCIVSHRSGETEDTTIADIAVGTASGQIKTGSFSRSERIAKYNRLAEIEIELTSANSTFYGLYSMFSLNFNNTELFKPKRYLLNEKTGEVKVEVLKESEAESLSPLPNPADEEADLGIGPRPSGKRREDHVIRPFPASPIKDDDDKDVGGPRPSDKRRESHIIRPIPATPIHDDNEDGVDLGVGPRPSDKRREDHVIRPVPSAPIHDDGDINLEEGPRPGGKHSKPGRKRQDHSIRSDKTNPIHDDNKDEVDLGIGPRPSDKRREDHVIRPIPASPIHDDGDNNKIVEGPRPSDKRREDHVIRSIKSQKVHDDNGEDSSNN